MLDMPFVGILAADAGEIRPGALGAPLERMVVHALGRQAVMAVTLDLVAQRADLLAVAEIAALAEIDVATGQLERRTGPGRKSVVAGKGVSVRVAPGELGQTTKTKQKKQN